MRPNILITKGFTMTTRLWCAAVCLLAVSAVARGQDKVQIKMTYAPGTYEMTTRMEMANTSAYDGQEMPGQKMTIEMVMVTTVGQPDAKGSRPVTIKYSSFKQKIETPAATVSYDSSKPAEEQSKELAAVLSPLLKATITATLDEQGRFVNVKGLDEMWDSMAATSPQMKLTAQEMKKSVGDDAMAAMMNKQSELLPDTPVGVGDTFKKSAAMPLPMLGKMDVAFSGKVAQIDKTAAGNLVTIDFVGKGSLPKKTTTQMGSTNVDMDEITFSQQGPVVFDATQGIVTSANFKQNLVMIMTITPPPTTQPSAASQPAHHVRLDQSGEVKMMMKRVADKK